MLRLAVTLAFLFASLVSAADLSVVYILGDSTVNNHGNGLLGWGDPVKTLFDASKITVENRARGGRSSRTYFTEGLWDQVLFTLKPGDFVLMQFGHNDGGPIADGRARASLKGIGEETQEIDNKTTGKHETVHTYGWYMRRYIADAKAKGAVPIVLSPVPRNDWADGKVLRTSKDYGKWAAEAAQTTGACFIDLNELVARRYEELGAEKVKAFFPGDHTHTSEAGAKLNTEAVVEGVRGLKDCKLASYLLP